VNPGNGVVNFDSFLWSLINVYVITSLANWSDIMYPIWDTTSFYSSLYFVSLILIGAYFAVNLCLVRCSCDDVTVSSTAAAFVDVCEHC
jgi:hypothetical protein